MNWCSLCNEPVECSRITNRLSHIRTEKHKNMVATSPSYKMSSEEILFMHNDENPIVLLSPMKDNDHIDVRQYARTQIKQVI